MSYRSSTLSNNREERIVKSWKFLLESQRKGACVVLFDPSFRVLLCKRGTNTDWMPEKWGFPGGGIEEGEDPKEAAIREAKEETDLDVEFLNEFHETSFAVFFTTKKFSGNVKLSDEHTEFAWVSEDHLKDYDIIPGNDKIVIKALQKVYGR